MKVVTTLLRPGFWQSRQQLIRRVTLPAQYDWCRRTGRIDAWRLKWRPGRKHRPHIFWDSDIAKWIESAAYSLDVADEAALRRRVDQLIELLARAQRPDGYLNTYFIAVEPSRRWTNLRGGHELYCAGHLIEAATAWQAATGDDRLLSMLCRYADHIERVFGRRSGQKRGYCGHPEIELALVKLYRATGERRYLQLARYFVDERGRRPHYFSSERGAPGEEVPVDDALFRYTQSHLPVRAQRDAVGHAVRALYLYAGMADVAAETNDRALTAACRRLWTSVTERRMYVTGGVGSTRQGEAFTFDYDLPNETAYCETCAAVALVMFAHRMLQLDADSKYADVMERALYNAVLAGISLDGRRFFYANPLTVTPDNDPFLIRPMAVERQAWFDCACCPPNLARLVLSLGRYISSTRDDRVSVHLYTASTIETAFGKIDVRTKYPWEEIVDIRLRLPRPADFSLALRIPGWCAKVQQASCLLPLESDLEATGKMPVVLPRNPTLRINGRPLRLASHMERGYAVITRRWRDGDRLALRMPMPILRVQSHPRVRQNAGCVALQRGPIVYCVEQKDNGPDLHRLILPQSAKLTARFRPRLLGGVTTISGTVLRETNDTASNELYLPNQGTAATRRVKFSAVPYFAWGNRGRGEMRVWLRRK